MSFFLNSKEGKLLKRIEQQSDWSLAYNLDLIKDLAEYYNDIRPSKVNKRLGSKTETLINEIYKKFYPADPVGMTLKILIKRSLDPASKLSEFCEGEVSRRDFDYSVVKDLGEALEEIYLNGNAYLKGKA